MYNTDDQFTDIVTFYTKCFSTFLMSSDICFSLSLIKRYIKTRQKIAIENLQPSTSTNGFIKLMYFTKNHLLI